jgi:hypothetical protein
MKEIDTILDINYIYTFKYNKRTKKWVMSRKKAKK